MEDEEVDWLALEDEADDGQLMAFLNTLPRDVWHSALDPEYGRTLLHYACRGDNAAAVVALVAHGLDVNARDEFIGLTPAGFTVRFRQPRMLEMLCAAGAALRASDDELNAPLDGALLHNATACARVLVANGVRLDSAREDLRHLITPELVAFERGVLRCRCAAVALLRVKRAGRLVCWDKFLLAHLALHVWTTRTAEEWQE